MTLAIIFAISREVLARVGVWRRSAADISLDAWRRLSTADREAVEVEAVSPADIWPLMPTAQYLSRNLWERGITTRLVAFPENHDPTASLSTVALRLTLGAVAIAAGIERRIAVW